MQAKKDTQKKLLFKFVDEESDDYFKRSDERELQFDGGNDDDKNKKMAMIVAGVVIVGLLVGFFALRKGDDAAAEATYASALATPDSTVDDDGNCASGAAPADEAGCDLTEQGYTVAEDQITDSAGESEATAQFCAANADYSADALCVDVDLTTAVPEEVVEETPAEEAPVEEGEAPAEETA